MEKGNGNFWRHTSKSDIYSLKMIFVICGKEPFEYFNYLNTLRDAFMRGGKRNKTLSLFFCLKNYRTTIAGVNEREGEIKSVYIGLPNS